MQKDIKELIEELGPAFLSLDNLNGEWRASGGDFQEGWGYTPEEALEDLLELVQKDKELSNNE
jgi:hypothetical protein